MDAFIRHIKALKDIFWAIGIVICLIALLVGVIIAGIPKYYGDKADVLYLGADKNEKTAEIVDVSAGTSGTAGAETGKLTMLPETDDAGAEYLSSLTFLTDSTMIGLRDYGLVTSVWGSPSGSLPFNSLASATIKYPGDGSEISIANAAMIAKPSVLVICVGSDGLASEIEGSFISGYEALIDSILAVSPDTRIVLCSLCSVVNSYAGSDGLNASIMLQANEWIKQVCSEKGAYYANICPELTNSGYLSSSYASSNGKTLSSAGVNLVLNYLRNHAIQ